MVDDVRIGAQAMRCVIGLFRICEIAEMARLVLQLFVESSI